LQRSAVAAIACSDLVAFGVPSKAFLLHSIRNKSIDPIMTAGECQTTNKGDYDEVRYGKATAERGLSVHAEFDLRESDRTHARSLTPSLSLCHNPLLIMSL
jgi:hypothetical protein